MLSTFPASGPFLARIILTYPESPAAPDKSAYTADKLHPLQPHSSQRSSPPPAPSPPKPPPHPPPSRPLRPPPAPPPAARPHLPESSATAAPALRRPPA